VGGRHQERHTTLGRHVGERGRGIESVDELDAGVDPGLGEGREHGAPLVDGELVGVGYVHQPHVGVDRAGQ